MIGLFVCCDYSPRCGVHITIANLRSHHDSAIPTVLYNYKDVIKLITNTNSEFYEHQIQSESRTKSTIINNIVPLFSGAFPLSM